MADVLLIAADWQFRALVRAQLLEEGISVRALPSVKVALAHLARSGERPRVTVVDTKGIDVEAQSLSALWQLCGKVPLLLCGGVFNQATLRQEGMPPAQVLVRPFGVGDLVVRIQGLLSCLKGNPIGA